MNAAWNRACGAPGLTMDYYDGNTDNGQANHQYNLSWFTGRIGDSSFDERSGRLNSLFDFTASNNKQVPLKSNGSVKSITPIHGGRAMRATRVVRRK